MSLLNEMLIDLDQRDENQRLFARRDLLEGDTDTESKAKKTFAGVVAILLSAFAGYFLYSMSTDKGWFTDSVPAVSQTVKAKPETAVSEVIRIDTQPAHDIAIKTPPQEKPGLKEQQGNPVPVSGPAKEENVISNTELPTADHSAAEPRLANLEQQLAELPASAAGDHSRSSGKAIANRPADKTAIASPELPHQDSQQRDVRADVKKSKDEQEQNSALHIALSPETLDWQQAEYARKLRQKSHDHEAEKVLLKQLQAWPDSVISLQLLADLYFDKARRNDLAALATEQKFEDVSLRAYVLARLYTLDGQVSLAIDLLEKPFSQEKVHSGIEEAYLGLMAALYQQKSSYADAEILFRQLLKKNPSEVRHWLGLALASDAQNKNMQALQAFQKVERLGAPSPRVDQYVQQRITQLAGIRHTGRQGS